MEIQGIVHRKQPHYVRRKKSSAWTTLSRASTVVKKRSFLRSQAVVTFSYSTRSQISPPTGYLQHTMFRLVCILTRLLLVRVTLMWTNMNQNIKMEQQLTTNPLRCGKKLNSKPPNHGRLLVKSDAFAILSFYTAWRGFLFILFKWLVCCTFRQYILSNILWVLIDECAYSKPMREEITHTNEVTFQICQKNLGLGKSLNLLLLKHHLQSFPKRPSLELVPFPLLRHFAR